eukprot:6190183-Pleurochrysis_carterae.AAC.2
MTPRPEHGASSSTRSKPPIAFGKSRLAATQTAERACVTSAAIVEETGRAGERERRRRRRCKERGGDGGDALQMRSKPLRACASLHARTRVRVLVRRAPRCTRSRAWCVRACV